MKIDLKLTKQSKKFFYGLMAGIVVFLLASFSSTQAPEGQTAVSNKVINTNEQTKSTSTNAYVVRVVDGDTMVAILDSEPDKEYKVRFLGVNTPETVDPRKPVECFGKQASDYVKSQLNNTRVMLKSDPEADEIDKYGRLLRNVFLEDGTDFCAQLVRMGYAYAYTSFPLNAERKTELRELQAEAQESGAGLWNKDECNN